MDSDGIHWWARDIDEIPIDGVGKDIIMRHPVSFNCCLRGVESAADGSKYVEGFSIIERNEPDFGIMILVKYPSLNLIERIFEYECVRQLLAAEKIANYIKLLFEEKCPWWLSIGDASDDYLRLSGGDDARVQVISPPRRKKLPLGMSEASLRN